MVVEINIIDERATNSQRMLHSAGKYYVTLIIYYNSSITSFELHQIFCFSVSVYLSLHLYHQLIEALFHRFSEIRLLQ